MHPDCWCWVNLGSRSDSGRAVHDHPSAKGNARGGAEPEVREPSAFWRVIFFYPRFPCRRAPRTYGCTAPRVPVFVCPPAPARRWAAAGRMRSDRHLTPTARGMMRTEWSLAPRARLVRRCRRRCAAGPSVGESCGRPVSGCLRRPMGYSTADPM